MSESLYDIPPGCICMGDGLMGMKCDAASHAKLKIEEPLCPDSPDGNHHVAPIGSEEEWMPSKAPCYYCGDKQALATRIPQVGARNA